MWLYLRAIWVSEVRVGDVCASGGVHEKVLLCVLKLEDIN